MSAISSVQECSTLHPYSADAREVYTEEAAPPDIPDRRDYKGQRLCDPCWNGQHYHRKVGRSGKARGGIIIDCLAGECECPCRALLAEQGRKISEQPKKGPQSPGNSNQFTLFEAA